VLVEGAYNIPKDGVMQPTEYFEFLLGRLCDVIAEAWQSRAPGAVGWGLGTPWWPMHRRAVYADGHAEMYARRIARLPRHGRLRGSWRRGAAGLGSGEKLLATGINVACPAQEVEHHLAVNATTCTSAPIARSASRRRLDSARFGSALPATSRRT
jgi:hypothetical protein